MEIISRKEALERGLKRYFTGEPCKYGHVSERFVRSWKCCQCGKESIAKCRNYHREYGKKYSKENASKRAISRREYYLKSKPQHRARVASRRAAKKLRTPSWLTEEDKRNILAVYKMSERLSQCMGIEHHVDHIIPLRGESICGLHVPWNLQAVPAMLNFRKNNKLCSDFSQSL